MSAQTIIHNTTIVTADDQDSIHYDAALVVEGDRLAAIGPAGELLGRFPAAERVNGRGRAVMPGIANTHTHMYLTLARGIFEDLSPSHTPPFAGGLARLPLPQLTPAEYKVMCELGALEAIRSGTTLLLEDGIGLDRYAASGSCRRSSASSRRSTSTRSGERWPRFESSAGCCRRNTWRVWASCRTASWRGTAGA